MRIPIDAEAEQALSAAVARARALADTIDRPPVAQNERLCAHCTLAPVCLPEEERLLAAREEAAQTSPPRLFPADDERIVLHVTDAGTRVGKRGEQIRVTPREGTEQAVPAHDVAAIVLHGAVQISAQLIHFAAARDIAVHWLSGGGTYVGAIAPPGGVQRRLRQYRGLADAERCDDLTRRLVRAKLENQLGFLIRGSRSRKRWDAIADQLDGIRGALRGIERDRSATACRGHEGMAGRHYFAALRELLDPEQTLMAFSGRNRRPPQDPFNAALSFGYSLLYRDVMAAILCLGLDPALGFFHTPRSAAYPLALDLMELFRTTLWDMPLVAYDIRDQGRWRDAYKILKGSGERIQYSLFRCRLSKTEMERLRWESKGVEHQRDRRCRH